MPNSNQKPLYIIFHVMKCAGTTLRMNILFSKRKDEVLSLYDKAKPLFPKTRRNIENYIRSLSPEAKDQLEVIIGHKVYYGLHELFPEREVRYVVFLREPVARTISHYNYSQGRRKSKRDLESWLRNREGVSNVLTKWLVNNFGELEKYQSGLNRFYFVGLVERREDFNFIYNKLGISPFFSTLNRSRSYVASRSSNAIKLVSRVVGLDRELYRYATKLNKKLQTKIKGYQLFSEKNPRTRFCNWRSLKLLPFILSSKLTDTDPLFFINFYVCAREMIKKIIKKIFWRLQTALPWAKSLAIKLNWISKPKSKFIIFGFARSGTTILKRLMWCYPGISCRGEPFNHGNNDYRVRYNRGEKLADLLDELFNQFSGIKHMADQLPEADNRQVLSQVGIKVIFIYRRNALRRAISYEISQQARYWGNDRSKIQGRQYLPVSIELLAEEIATYKQKVEKYREFLKKTKVPMYELTYEDLYDESLETQERILNEIYDFLGRPHSWLWAHRPRIRYLLDPHHSKLNSESTYRLIPNIKEVEMELGNQNNGFLFQ